MAAGSFGVVYKGKVKGIKGYVAVKDIDLLTKDAANAWKQEIELMSLNHSRYVVNVYGYSYSDKRLSIVMEYMNRGSLRSLLHDSKIQLPLIHRIRMARHCIRGLIFLHLNGIVHRDIKSANILVGKDYSCKISDFGCAKLMENLIDENSDRVGTPLWMAPEVTKRKEYSVSADVYSMGIVVYEILEGDLPVFDKEEKRAKLPLNFLTQKVVMPCLSDNPNERPPLGDLLEALDRWIRQLLIQIHAGLPNDWRKKAQLSFEFQIESGRTKGLKSSDGLNFEELIKLYNFLIFQDINKVNNLLDKVLTNIEPPYLQHNSTSPPDSSESLNDSEAFSDDWGTTSSGSDDETIIKKITKPKKHIKKSDSMIDDLGIDDLSLLKAINKRKLSGSKNSVPLLSTLPQMNTKRSSAKRPTRLEGPESPKSPKTPLSNSSTPPKLSGHSNYRRAVSHSTSPVLPKNPKEPKDPKSSSGELRPPNMNRKSSTSIIHSPSKKNARSPPMPTSTGPSLVSSNDLQSTDIAQLMEEELQRLMGMSIIEMINNPDYDKRGNSSTHKKLT
uniref:Protein kinase domain-containing protein n=1 Tax=Arcella intermedia TaxID=1963864 RepID=A0A6B2L174_9EUKA